jgi:2-succinyl-6-hydroxy-2,4-cyclohexadiene-1-carboxylate synthase
LGCKEDWEEMIPFFEGSYYCIAVDLPGHGATPYSENITSTLREEIRQMGGEKPILVGYSMGGRLALELMDEAKSLIVLSGHPGLQTEEEKAERMAIDEQWSEKLLTLPLETFLTQWYEQPIFHHVPQSILNRRMSQNPRELSLVLRQKSLAHQKRYDDFSCPTLFVCGEYDLKYRQLYVELPKTVEVSVVDGSSHAVHIENAALCSKLILNWLDCLKDAEDIRDADMALKKHSKKRDVSLKAMRSKLEI